jgi:hypothetical protein
VVCSSTSSDAGLDYMHLFLESFWVVWCWICLVVKWGHAYLSIQDISLIM